MYRLHEHGWMLGDDIRTGSYIEALRRTVEPGSVVLDLGTGIGTWAIVACRFGARRVFAIDPSDVIEVGRELAAANGCADRIEFIRALSTDVSLPERVDVIVGDIHGVLPMFGRSLATLIDARSRFLAPGGVLIPGRESIWAALVHSPDLYALNDRPWGDGEPEFNLDPVRVALVNYWRKRLIQPEAVVAPPKIWSTLTYGALESPHVDGTLEWSMTQPATLHGMAVWFDTVLTDGVGFSNAPGLTETGFGHAFFPYLHPVDVEPGDAVHVDMAARLIDRDYVWQWTISVDDRNGARRVQFRQSDFWSEPISPERLARAHVGYAPGPNPDRDAVLFVLERFDDDSTVAEIADALHRRFPGRFPTAEMAVERVVDLAREYGIAPSGPAPASPLLTTDD